MKRKAALARMESLAFLLILGCAPAAWVAELPPGKMLCDFETDAQGWWPYTGKDATLTLAQDGTAGAGGSAASLKASYRYGKGEGWLGMGIQTKFVMGDETWPSYAGGFLGLSLKSDAPCGVTIELRTTDKKTYSIGLRDIGAEWATYGIPFSEFRDQSRRLDLKGAVIDAIVLVPHRMNAESHSLWLDRISISKEPLKLPEAEVRVEGKATDAESKPLAAASILLNVRGKGEPVARATTTPDGAYTLSATLTLQGFVVIPESTKPVEIPGSVVGLQDGFQTAVASVTLKVGATTCDLALKPMPTTVAELRVVGNRLQTKEGKEVWLQGLCVDSLEWSVGGERILQSLPVAIEQWRSNVIRLPIRNDHWSGAKQKDGGEGYRKLLDAAVEATSSRGAYLALDLHVFGAPMPEHLEFWREAALRYRNHPGVLFELFNEAHGISWKVWRDGGSLKDPENKNKDSNAAENNEKTSGDRSVGMQALVDAVRATGARNIVIAGGLDWGYDLSGVVQEYALQDREGGNGIMYSSHIYPWKSDWQGKTLAAAEKYPIFIGEVGCSPKPMPWQKTTEDPNTWAPDMIGLIQKHKLNWTAFSFHPTCGPNVISDWKYTPTPYWGTFVKDALGGKTFELKRMR